jgi:hypothetical protein
MKGIMMKSDSTIKFHIHCVLSQLAVDTIDIDNERITVICKEQFREVADRIFNLMKEDFKESGEE